MAEYPNIDLPVMEPTVLPQPIFNTEIGVQTNSSSLFDLFINWFKEIFSITSSEAESFTQNHNRIINWVENVENNSIPLPP